MTTIEFELLVQRLRYMQHIEVIDDGSIKSGLYLGSYNRTDNTFKLLNGKTNEVEKIVISSVSIRVL